MPKKRYTAAFKSKVALEAIKWHKTISEIASEYSVYFGYEYQKTA